MNRRADADRYLPQALAEAVRLRFFAPIKEVTHETATGFTQIDYDREIALVLGDRYRPGFGGTLCRRPLQRRPRPGEGGVCAQRARRRHRAWFGPLLMRRLIEYARERGIFEIFGHVLRENRSILAICRLLGF
jgi:acetyltransferase